MNAIHIMLHGLIALVPLYDNAGDTNHMIALVVDSSRRPTVPADCLAEHTPELTFDHKANAQCLAADCVVKDSRCVCALAHDDISLLIQPEFTPAPQHQLKKAPDSSLPFDKAAASDFSYIPNLAQEKLGRRTVDPDLLATPIPAMDPQPLIGRMKFPFTSVRTCSLGTRRAGLGNNVHAMGFRALRATEAAGDLSQAVAQSVMFHLDIPDDRTIAIRLEKFGQAAPRDIELKPGSRVELTNMRKAETRIGDPCDDGVGRDFAFFYNLLSDPPDWEQRKIPHVQHTQWKSALDVDPDCPGHKDPNSRPICPMASFN